MLKAERDTLGERRDALDVMRRSRVYEYLLSLLVNYARCVRNNPKRL